MTRKMTWDQWLEKFGMVCVLGTLLGWLIVNSPDGFAFMLVGLAVGIAVMFFFSTIIDALAQAKSSDWFHRDLYMRRGNLPLIAFAIIAGAIYFVLARNGVIGFQTPFTAIFGFYAWIGYTVALAYRLDSF